jgi:hypothetical protein
LGEGGFGQAKKRFFESLAGIAPAKIPEFLKIPDQKGCSNSGIFLILNIS